MPATHAVQAELKINGLAFPFDFLVVEKLGYDVILGDDLLTHTSANIDKGTNTLSLFGGLVTISMTKTGNAPTVRTVGCVVIPAYSEATFPIHTTRRVPQGDYIIEENLCSPCRQLLVARALVDPARGNLQCRALNPTGKEIRLRPHTTIGALAPVTVEQQAVSTPPPEQNEPLPPVAEMRHAL